MSSEPYAIIVQPDGHRSLDAITAYGPFEEDEADALARRLRGDFEMRAAVVRLRAWDEPR
jgi:hypothetical protein